MQQNQLVIFAIIVTMTFWILFRYDFVTLIAVLILLHSFAYTMHVFSKNTGQTWNQKCQKAFFKSVYSIFEETAMNMQNKLKTISMD